MDPTVCGLILAYYCHCRQNSLLDFMKCREREYREKREHKVYVIQPNSLHPQRVILDGYIFTILSIHLVTMNPK